MKIQSGEVAANKDDIEWELHKKAGTRSWMKTIRFDEDFMVPPTVVASLSGFDIHQGKNPRLMVSTKQPEKNQFKLEIKTWNDTWVHSTRVAWIAYGQ